MLTLQGRMSELNSYRRLKTRPKIESASKLLRVSKRPNSPPPGLLDCYPILEAASLGIPLACHGVAQDGHFPGAYRLKSTLGRKGMFASMQAFATFALLT